MMITLTETLDDLRRTAALLERKATRAFASSMTMGNVGRDVSGKADASAAISKQHITKQICRTMSASSSF
jgi:hypothetical protein